jgi:hypothetical protein
MSKAPAEFKQRHDGASVSLETNDQRRLAPGYQHLVALARSMGRRAAAEAIQAGRLPAAAGGQATTTIASVGRSPSAHSES